MLALMSPLGHCIACKSLNYSFAFHIMKLSEHEEVSVTIPLFRGELLILDQEASSNKQSTVAYLQKLIRDKLLELEEFEKWAQDQQNLSDNKAMVEEKRCEEIMYKQ